MNLVTTRQKLQPFICEGVVYKDRKKRKEQNEVLEIMGGNKMLMFRISNKIAEYRKEIRKNMKKNRIKDL